jgi:hypothetical protein
MVRTSPTAKGVLALDPVNRMYRISAGLVAILAGTIGLCALSPAAFAATTVIPTDGGSSGSTPAAVQTVMLGDMPGWQIALIAIGAALVAGVAAVLVDRARSARRPAICHVERLLTGGGGSTKLCATNAVKGTDIWHGN